MLSVLFLLPLLSVGSFASDVLVFTDNNFEKNVKEHPIILVEFYAPWCGHCKKLAPEYEVAATKLKKIDPPVSLAKVDCTAETKICEKHGVSGYPTLKVFRDGAMAFDYNGGRDADGIVKYMTSKAGPLWRELKTKEELEKFVSTSSPVVLGVFKEANSAMQKAFEGVATRMAEDFRFALTNNHELVEQYGLDNHVAIFTPKAMHSKFEEKIRKYTGHSDTEDLRVWIEKNIMGLAGIRTSDNDKYFSERPLVVAYYNVDYDKNAKSSNYWRNRLMKVVKEVRDKTGKAVHLAISSVSSPDLRDYGVEMPDDKKVYIAARDQSGKKFSMSDDFSVDSFQKWLTSFMDGKVEPYLKSEALPAKNDKPVKVLVGKNFDDIVNDPTKDVLIEFYAPWCGHCKSLEPKYDELAEKLKGEKDIVIAKMDATANDVPSTYTVTGFPTIYFAPKKGKTSPKKYSGAREVDDFIRYIAESSTSPLSGFDRRGNAKAAKSEL